MAITTTVMLPYRPTMDRNACFDILQHFVGRELDIMFADQASVLTHDDVKTLSDSGITMVGIGKGRTYRDRTIDGRKVWSETELLLHDLRSIMPTTRTLQDFAAMMSRNNRDGYLVRQPYSVNRIVRDAYRLGHDPKEVMYTFSDEEVVRNAAHVVRMYLDAQERGSMDLAMRERFKRLPAMELLPEGARDQYGPMTVLRYMRDMFTLDIPDREIFWRAEWFVRINDRAAEREEQAEAQVLAGDFDTFEIPGHGFAGTWIESDDPFLQKPLNKHRDLVAICSSHGNVIITSRGFDLRKVGAVLQTQEAGIWHIEAERNIVANGTERVAGIPTKLPPHALQYIIGANAVYKRR